MKKVNLLFLVFFMSFISFSQEICDNGIDDDGDGLIDLLDDECDCDGLIFIDSYVPNHSFEDTVCCPMGLGAMSCAENWTQASEGTSDYYNSCGIDDFLFGIEPELPLPGGGEGFTGLIKNFVEGGGKEYIAVCLDETLIAGIEYTFSFYVAWSSGSSDFDISLFGTPDCGDFPWFGYDCPLGVGDWDLLVHQENTFPTDGSWTKIYLTFTPDVAINAIAIGGPCLDGIGYESDVYDYYYFDEFDLTETEYFPIITETGNRCDEDLLLNGNIDTIGGAWQWYKEGIALVGEVGETVDPVVYGFGEYTAIYTLDGICERINYTVPEEVIVEADFITGQRCTDETVEFLNTTVLSDPDADIIWEWDFGDESTSSDLNPDHLFPVAGSYLVKLVVHNANGCDDSIEVVINVDPRPEAQIEFIINGLSSIEDGIVGGCIESPVQFNDASTIEDPGILFYWAWSFGDDSSSSSENPNHIYDEAGIYTVVLNVTSVNGCTSTDTVVIAMTDPMTWEINYNEPSCYGLMDGSVTVNVFGTTGDIEFEITDSLGEILNEDNSNTANNLATGWYYIHVTDETTCDAVDSVFLTQPEELDAHITVTNIFCFGSETGSAVVDTVFNASGDYTQISYHWEPNPGGNGGIGEDSTWGMPPGQYALIVNDENGCSAVIDFEIMQNDSMYLTEFGIQPPFCRLYGYQNGNGVVFAAATGGTPDYSYNWKNLDTEEETNTSTWGGLNPGNYKLTVTDDKGCLLEKVFYLDSVNPEAIFTVNSAQLNTDCQGTASVEVVFTNNSIYFADPNDPTADTTFYWNLDNPSAPWQLSKDLFESFDTTYKARGYSYTVDVCLATINKNGCRDTMCKDVVIYEPIRLFDEVNIFSPNGDNLNDIFTMKYKSASISELHCVIYNRWGVIVNEFEGIDNGWDGKTYQGNECTAGVYFFKYTAVSDNNTPLEGHGSVQLVR